MTEYTKTNCKRSWADEVDDDSDDDDSLNNNYLLCNIDDEEVLEDLDENDLNELDKSIYEMNLKEEVEREIEEHKELKEEVEREIEEHKELKEENIVIGEKIDKILDNFKMEINNKIKNSETFIEEKKTIDQIIDKQIKIVYHNNSMIKIKNINDIMASIEDVNSIENNITIENKKYRDMYHYVTARIKIPFNQFNKMIRIDYHYNERRLQIYRIYTVMNKDDFEKIYLRIVDDFTEELFKTCFIDDNKLYIPFLYSKEEGKYYDMLKYIKSNKEYELLLYVINF